MRDESHMNHGRNYERHNIRGWYVSEKCDGVRVRWDGSDLWLREGNRVPAPSWFTAGLPKRVELDAELYAGRGLFDHARLAAVNGLFDDRHVLAVFDCPTAAGDWKQRLLCAARAIRSASNAVVVDFWPGGTHSQNMTFLGLMQADGAEGLVAVRPGVPYRPGRSANILKLKTLLF